MEENPDNAIPAETVLARLKAHHEAHVKSEKRIPRDVVFARNRKPIWSGSPTPLPPQPTRSLPFAMLGKSNKHAAVSTWARSVARSEVNWLERM